MRRMKRDGVVHFRGTHDHTLCGIQAFDYDLMGAAVPVMSETTERVNCPHCATLYCQVKNTRWNAVDEDVLMKACLDAVKDGGEE